MGKTRVSSLKGLTADLKHVTNFVEKRLALGSQEPHKQTLIRKHLAFVGNYLFDSR
jgi:hypothetical protein